MIERRMYPTEVYNLYHGPQYSRPSFYAGPFRSYSLPSRPAELGLAQLRQHQHHQQIINYQNHFQFQPVFSQPPAVMEYMQPEELEQFQKLSNEYQPEATGPLVSNKLPSSAITTEYAAADPIYQVKTAALPRTYSSYRTCRGDGRCGWRAIAFGYYESLLRTGDHNKFLQEEVRLKSLRNICKAAGFDLDILETFEDTALDLLRTTAATLYMPHAEATLVEAFNNEEIQNFVITYFRELTAAWVQTRPDNYAPFVLPMTVEEYCSTTIMAHTAEINEVGINALAEVLLKPAGFALEIIYLDLSEGTDANVHHFGPMSTSVATIRLLYRPGHYDVLYKAEDTVSAPTNVQASAPSTQFTNVPTYQAVPCQTTFPEHYIPDSVVDLPGMSLVNTHIPWSMGSFYDDLSSEVPLVPTLLHEQTPVESIPAAFSHAEDFDAFAPQQEVESGSIGPSSQSGLSSRLMAERDGGFRPSKHMYEKQLFRTPLVTHDVEFRTAQFKNSHHNRSHFQNANFQPEPWDPSTEYVTPSTRSTRRHGRMAH